MIIDENQLSSAHNISNTTTFETTNKQPPTTIDQNGYCYKLAPISAWGTMDIEILHSEVLFKQSISNSIHTIVQRW